MINRRQEVKDLIGAVVMGAEVMATDGGDMVPVLLLRKERRYFQVEAWQDEEGNGGGFLSIGPVVSRG